MTTATKLIVATIMRPTGETGVQTHFNSFLHYLDSKNIKQQLITPFSFPLWLVYPVFAVRTLIHKLSSVLSVWWYRYWHYLFLHLALKRLLKSETACVIYAQCPLSAAAALKARVSRQQRVIMVTHFNISQADEWVGKGLIKPGGRYYQAIQKFEAEVLPQLDGIVFVSEFMRAALYQRISAISGLANVVIPNFLPDPGEPETNEISADLISIGTLEDRKNQKYLLEILAAMHEQGNPVTLTIIGDGPDRTMLLETAKTLNVLDLVNFTGFVNNAANHINHHKALIHVASMENLPVALLEAMARGRPIFAVPVGGIPELLAGGDIGLALPADNAYEAAALISNALKNKVWMHSAGLVARQQFLAHYVSEVSAQRLTDFLTTY